MGYSEYTGKATDKVEAEQLTEQRTIITPNGPVTGNEGDWEVRSAGNVRRLTDDEFQEEYGSGTGDKSDMDTGPTSAHDAGDEGSPLTDREHTRDADPHKVTDTSDDSGSQDEADEETDPQTEDRGSDAGSKAESLTETPRAAPPRRR